MNNKLQIYTDGACSGNPGIGGWGAVLINRNTGEEKYLSGAENVTTNNKMELTATIESLKSNKPPGSLVSGSTRVALYIGMFL